MGGAGGTDAEVEWALGQGSGSRVGWDKSC